MCYIVVVPLMTQCSFTSLSHFQSVPRSKALGSKPIGMGTIQTETETKIMENDMSLDWNIQKLDNDFVWITCKTDHPLYSEIKRDLKSSRIWFVDDDGEIKCMNPFVRFMIFETLNAKCGKVTKSNIAFWNTHLIKAYFHTKGFEKPSAYQEIVAEWTDEGWIYRQPKTTDIEQCIGLVTNA